MTNDTQRETSPSDDDVLIRVDGASKKFCRSLKKSLWYGVTDMVGELSPFARHGVSRTGELRDEEFWAVKNVSFELRRGECLGLIGHNGAGKRTLLKMLNGLIKPDEGRIEVKGRVGALIALGAGFNPILSGRENIYVNASILGLADREINQKLDEIIDFAELREFIDSPVQSYSTGMQVRLGFAIATALQPDVLILDEVLAVGDAGFQFKCLSRISALKKSCAVIFVSHTMSNISRIANTAMLFEKGRMVNANSVSDAIRGYRSTADKRPEQSQSQKLTSSEICVENICFTQTKSQGSESETGEVFLEQDSLTIEATIECKATIDCFFTLTFRNSDGIAVAECPSLRNREAFHFAKGCRYRVSLNLCPVHLGPGDFLCSLYILDVDCCKHYAAWTDFRKLTIEGDNRFTSPIHFQGNWRQQRIDHISQE